MKQKIETLKERQERGEYLRCPRCGSTFMDPNPVRNALSRHADVYVCDICGTDEALRDMLEAVIPISEWWYARVNTSDTSKKPVATDTSNQVE